MKMKNTVALIAFLAAFPVVGMAQQTNIALNDFDDFIDIEFEDEADLDFDFDDINIAFTEINTGISGDFSDVANTVLSATAVNTAFIDGSINIASIGESTSDLAETTNDAFDAGLGEGAFYSSDDLVMELEDLTIGTSAASTASESTTASLQIFGDVSSVAAGALNTATFTVSETAGTTMASSAGETLTTLASASDEIASGSGLLVTSDALNTALIDGSITANLDGGNITFTSIGSVAAGALNTVTVDAGIVGRVTSAAPRFTMN
jgi:hypothetical protein